MAMAQFTSPVRRWLLRQMLGAIGAAASFGAGLHFSAAAIKISQKAVAYQDHPEGDKRCDKCAQYQPPNTCKLVDGAISPNGYCRLFALNRQADANFRNLSAILLVGAVTLSALTVAYPRRAVCLPLYASSGTDAPRHEITYT
jgi:hypothetical protein